MDNTGIVFGGYYLLGRLAAGGMAEVFLGKSLAPSQPDQLLAIKTILPRLSEDPTFVSMFIDEARIASGLSHPNIARIFDQGRFEDQLYIAMEFVHGKDLQVLKRRARKRGETIPPDLIAFTVAKIAEALDHAHSRPERIVHRDVSPQNILLSYDGAPKLIDFGVAKAKHRLAQTRVGMVKGKFAYMSPEQATGQELDARTDIFALGVVLYELLTGRLPFKGESDLSTLKRIARAEYVPPPRIDPTLSPGLVAVIDKALQRDPAARYASAAALAADLHKVADYDRIVDEAVLSAFLRRLFREDYIREMARIRAFRDTSPATPEVARRHSDPTLVTPSQFLAAGYDDGPPSGEGLNDEVATAGRLRFNTAEVDDVVTLLDDDDIEMADSNAFDFDEPTIRLDVPAEAGDWDGPVTDLEQPLPGFDAEKRTVELSATDFELPNEGAEEPSTRELPDSDVEMIREIAVADQGTEEFTVDADLEESNVAVLVEPSADEFGRPDEAFSTLDVPPELLPDASADISQATRTRRRRMLTNLEVAVLFLAAALGLALVVAAYLYASQVPLPSAVSDQPAASTPAR